MKQIDKSLADFIDAFDLESATKGICFEAKLYIFALNSKMHATSEIQIVTVGGKGFDVLYILNKRIGLIDFPTMFVMADFELSFNRRYGLKLKGWCKRWKFYTLVIQPIDKNCSEATLEELNAKANN